MSDKSKIEWTDASWNPVTGCTKVSSGCANCYAETFAERWRGIKGHPYEQGFDLKLWPERLLWFRTHKPPKDLGRPWRIFVNSMSDLFHEKVPSDFIAKVFAVMACYPQYTFQVLTKRPERMAGILSAIGFEGSVKATVRVNRLRGELPGKHDDPVRWPLLNVWLGTSVENQKTADQRIDWLMKAPAVVRFLSCEPLLGPVDLYSVLGQRGCRGTHRHAIAHIDGTYGGFEHHHHDERCSKLAWVIVGGESGGQPRPMETGWARSVLEYCRRAHVAFFMKQLGGRGDKKGQLEDFPLDLQVRQFPWGTPQ